MSSENTPKTRPYWHVDAKWIAGLMLAVMLNATLILSGLVQITAEQPAVEVLTMSTALMFSPNGLDDETDIEIMRLALALSPDGAIQPIPGMGISVQAEDFEGLTPREIRLNFFQQWAEAIYQDGIQGLAELADDAELKDQILEGGAAFNLLTQETHRGMKLVFNLAIAACVLMLIPVVVFSYRFGRVGSPGCAFFFASLPGALIFSLFGLAGGPDAAPVEAGGMTGVLSYWVREALPSLARAIDQSYLIFLALGVGLMLLAGVLGIIWRVARAARQ